MRDSPSVIVRGNYMIYRLTDQIYKIIKFKFTGRLLVSRDRETFEHTGEKLDCSLSRTKRLLLEKALCNPWDWFGTITLDKRKYDRYNLEVFYEDFSQFLRDTRKKGFEVKYIIVPEMHQDDAWHLHCLFYGLPPLLSFAECRAAGEKVPNYLVYSDYYNWRECQKKFGFCSFGRIRSPVRTAFYVTKYVTKNHERMVSEVGSKMFRPSRGLNKAEPHGEVYGHSKLLDSLLTDEYDFCSVGMTKVSNGFDWTFAFEEDGFEHLASARPLFDFDDLAFSSFTDDLLTINSVADEFEQLSF